MTLLEKVQDKLPAGWVATDTDTGQDKVDAVIITNGVNKTVVAASVDEQLCPTLIDLRIHNAFFWLTNMPKEHWR